MAKKKKDNVVKEPLRVEDDSDLRGMEFKNQAVPKAPRHLIRNLGIRLGIGVRGEVWDELNARYDDRSPDPEPGDGDGEREPI